MLLHGRRRKPSQHCRRARGARAGRACSCSERNATTTTGSSVARARNSLPPARLPALIGSPAGARARREQLKAGRLQDHPDELVRSRRFGPILLRQPRACTHRPMMSMGRPIDARASGSGSENEGSGAPAGPIGLRAWPSLSREKENASCSTCTQKAGLLPPACYWGTRERRGI